MVVNGSFTDGLEGWINEQGFWTISSGRLRGSILVTYAGIYQVIAVEQDRTYELTGVAQFQGNNDGATMIIIATDPTNTYQQVVSYSKGEEGSDEFHFTLYWRSGNATQLYIYFQLYGLPGSDYIYIDDVQLVRLSEPTVVLEDCDGNYIRDIDVYDRGKDRVNYIVSWYNLPDGCYRVCISGVDDTETNYLERALALGTEGGAPLWLEQGGFLKWLG